MCLQCIIFILLKDTNFNEPLKVYTDKEIQQMNLKYYNSEIHKACFCLPQFAKQVSFVWYTPWPRNKSSLPYWWLSSAFQYFCLPPLGIRGIKFYPYRTYRQWWVSGNYNTSLGIGSEPNSEVLGLWAEIIDFIWFIVFNNSLSNISAISWRPVLVVEEAGVPGENHRPWASNW